MGHSPFRIYLVSEAGGLNDSYQQASSKHSLQLQQFEDTSAEEGFEGIAGRGGIRSVVTNFTQVA